MKLVLAAVAFAAMAPAQNCDGCYYEDYTWGGGSVLHVYTYTPGAGDQEGECDPATCQTTPCVFTGSLDVRNNSNVPIDIFDASGAYLNRIPSGGHTPFAIEVKAYCGVQDGDDPWWHAEPVGGGAPTSGYVFSCSICAPNN